MDNAPENPPDNASEIGPEILPENHPDIAPETLIHIVSGTGPGICSAPLTTLATADRMAPFIRSW
ncbi:MAG: hypothetical protein ABIL25_03730 [candidate division WOR-3 bacterium]